MVPEIQRDVRIDKSLKNVKFQNVTFDGLNVFASKVVDCEFSNIHFKHSKLGSGTKFKNCRFDKCIIDGQYSTLGNPSTFLNCEFEDCKFIGKMIFMGAIFRSCKFSGTFKNNVFIDERRWFKNLYTFDNCDLHNVQCDNLTFNGTRTFKNCKLPKEISG